MANCDQGNNTLDPYQSIIDAINKGAKTLENQSDIIKPFIDQFDAIADSITTPTPTSTLNAALNQFTADAICASSTDLQPINNLISDCLNEANAAVKRYLRDILSNIESGIDLITDILILPEATLFKLFQKIWMLADNIKDLITGLDNKIQCVSLSSSATTYQSQIDDLNDRISAVTDDLRLADDGSFDSDVFLSGLGSSLKANVQAYNDRASNLKQEIENNISSTVDLTAQINPKRYF